MLSKHIGQVLGMKMAIVYFPLLIFGPDILSLPGMIPQELHTDLWLFSYSFLYFFWAGHIPLSCFGRSLALGTLFGFIVIN